jgi:hypothetical protein
MRQRDKRSNDPSLILLFILQFQILIRCLIDLVHHSLFTAILYYCTFQDVSCTFEDEQSSGVPISPVTLRDCLLYSAVLVLYWYSGRDSDDTRMQCCLARSSPCRTTVTLVRRVRLHLPLNRIQHSWEGDVKLVLHDRTCHGIAPILTLL